MVLWRFALCILFCTSVICSNTNETFVVSMWSNFPYPSYPSITRLAVEELNNNPSILPDIDIQMDYRYLPAAPDVISAMIQVTNSTLILGNEKSAVATYSGTVGTVYNIAQFSSTAITGRLSDKTLYPHVSRVVASGDVQLIALRDTIEYYYEQAGRGWNEISIIAHTDEYGVDLARVFINNIGDTLELLTYQQFLFRSNEFDIELREIKSSGARVIIAFMYSTTWGDFVNAANDFELIGENYVWLVSSALVGSPVFSVIYDDATLELSRGVIGIFEFIPFSGNLYDNLIETWASLDPEEYPAAGPDGVLSNYDLFQYDMIYIAAMAADIISKQGEYQLGVDRIPAEVWDDAIRSISFEGTSGLVEFETNGDRVGVFSITYYNPDVKNWELTAKWSEKDGYEHINDIIWFSNTTTIPDLDIREPFDYWSCHDGEKGKDPTGKEIVLHTPDRSDVDEIESHYHCDYFIDCWNLSDESVDCPHSYTILFIVFGVITGCLIILSFLVLLFVLVFGIILKYQRLRVSSPVFLVLVVLSIIVGYSSIFAWFGKPHPVACAFQPWLLGLPTLSMIVALSVKTFRIWKIFRASDTLRRQKISDLELFGLWTAIMIPAVLVVILWMIISTPTAKMQDTGEEDHYLCATGGFTGEPGGYVFFSILAAYGALILLVGVILSVITRKVPAMFNESKLLAVSIYNLSLLSIVIIPVFLVVQPYNPFIAWILRTIAILYAFTAVLVLQFTPGIIGIVVIDHCRNIDHYSSTNASSSVYRGSESKN